MDECVHIFKTFTSGFVKCWNVKELSKTACTRCKEVVNRQVKLTTESLCRRAKDVDNKGEDVRRYTNRLERAMDVEVALSNKLEDHSFH